MAKFWLDEQEKIDYKPKYEQESESIVRLILDKLASNPNCFDSELELKLINDLKASKNVNRNNHGFDSYSAKATIYTSMKKK